eukprot:TRINITY_DN59_c0_g1_i1.p1 TRINITY_DN59_c0_g1~~TRINITY_DN59_c0_g1_i1.p1  ORF type:complete len:189 (-),score=23.56 TRINITY_DN59_c0_g1_i1:58-624(-)
MTELVKQLHKATVEGDLKTVRTLVTKQKVDPNARDVSNITPLHRACQLGHADIVDFILSLPSSDPNVKDSSGDTPLHWCLSERGCTNAHESLKLERDRAKIIRALVKAGAIHNSTNHRGITPVALGLMPPPQNPYVSYVNTTTLSKFLSDLTTPSQAIGYHGDETKTPLLSDRYSDYYEKERGCCNII